MAVYGYYGIVKEFDKIIVRNWDAVTRADSEAKARSNLIFQFKASHKKPITSKITLPGTLTVELE